VPASRRSHLERIVERVFAARRVILTTHVNADGDGAGSEAAIGAWLAQRGVEAWIVNPTAFPPSFRFLLPRTDMVVDLSEDRAAKIVAGADLAIVLDTSEPDRITPVDGLIRSIPTLVIDHHPPGPRALGDGIQDVTAAATGELVYDLIVASGAEWPM